MAFTIPTLFEPNASALLDKISPHIDDSMLREIASADYRQQIEEYYAIIRRMRDERFVPDPGWVPMEVLELIRWSEPDRPDWKPGDVGDRGHWMRTFCCASILRVGGEKNGYNYISYNETLSALLASLDRLDVDFWREAGAMLTWFLMQPVVTEEFEECAFFGVAILFCVLRSKQIPEGRLIPFCEWINEQEHITTRNSFWNEGGSWLYRSTTYNQNFETWRMLGRRWKSLDLRFLPLEEKEWAEIVIELLSDES